MKLLFLVPLLLLIGGCAPEPSLLSKQVARDLERNVTRSAELSQQGECFEALEETEQALLLIRDQVLVDPQLRTNLIRGIEKLQIQIQDECEPL